MSRGFCAIRKTLATKWPALVRAGIRAHLAVVVGEAHDILPLFGLHPRSVVQEARERGMASSDLDRLSTYWGGGRLVKLGVPL